MLVKTSAKEFGKRVPWNALTMVSDQEAGKNMDLRKCLDRLSPPGRRAILPTGFVWTDPPAQGAQSSSARASGGANQLIDATFSDISRSICGPRRVLMA